MSRFTQFRERLLSPVGLHAVAFGVLAVATSYPLEQLGEADYAVRRLEPADVIKKIPQLKTNPQT